MADNYLEKKMEEYRSRSAAPKRPSAVSLNRLLLLNRSYRGYDQRRMVTADELRRISGVTSATGTPNPFVSTRSAGKRKIRSFYD